MDLTFDDGELAVRAAARQLFLAELGDDVRAAIEDDQDEPALRRVVSAVARGGWLAPAAPGSSLFDRMPFFAEAGAALAPGLVSDAIAGGDLVARLGSPELQAAVERGELLLTLASDRGRTGLAAAPPAPLSIEHGGNGVWRLQGKLTLVEYGAVADLALVFLDARGGQTAVVVDLRGPGVGRTPRPTFGNDFRADLDLDVELAAAVPELEDQGIAWARSAQLAIRVLECAGSARAVTRRTVDYVTTRHQFGKPLSQFQAVKQHAADMLILSEGAFLLATEALTALGSDGPRARALWWAASWVPRACKDVTLWAHQLHGGMGYARESHLFRWSERAKLRQIEIESELDHSTILDGLRAQPPVVSAVA